jgi:hypothetical protein
MRTSYTEERGEPTASDRGASMEVEETEVIELDTGRYIQLEKYREWPKLGVLWSVRRRVGESDYPLQRGSEDRIPAAGQEPEEVWGTLRDAALAAAYVAANADGPAPGAKKRPSLLARLFNRA